MGLAITRRDRDRTGGGPKRAKRDPARPSGLFLSTFSVRAGLLRSLAQGAASNGKGIKSRGA